MFPFFGFSITHVIHNVFRSIYRNYSVLKNFSINGMTALFNLGINSYNGWKFCSLCSLPLDTLILKYYQRAFTCIYYIYKRFYATFKNAFHFWLLERGKSVPFSCSNFIFCSAYDKTHYFLNPNWSIWVCLLITTGQMLTRLSVSQLLLWRRYLAVMFSGDLMGWLSELEDSAGHPSHWRILCSLFPCLPS